MEYKTAIIANPNQVSLLEQIDAELNQRTDEGWEIVHISTPQVSSSGLNWGGTQGGVAWQFVVVFKRPKA
jgi:hypothetical protein